MARSLELYRAAQRWVGAEKHLAYARAHNVPQNELADNLADAADAQAAFERLIAALAEWDRQ